MKPQISSSELAIFTDNYSEKAWHLASILLSIGRPACRQELAGKCSLFQASPEFVEFLCSIPNSPIFLGGNDFVWPSMVAYSAVVDFFSNSMPSVEIGFRDRARMLCGNVMRTYFRKRKKFGDENLPIVKKRAVFDIGNENERERTSFCSSEGIVGSCFQVGDPQTAHMGMTLDALPFGMSAHGIDLEPFSNIMAVTPVTMNSNVGLLGYQLENEDKQKRENKEITSLNSDVLKGVISVECPHDDYDNERFSNSRTLAPLLDDLAEISAMLHEYALDETNLMSIMDTSVPCIELQQQNRSTVAEVAADILASDDFRNDRIPEISCKEMIEWPLMDYGSPKKVEQFTFGSCERNTSPRNKLCQKNLEASNCGILITKNKPLNAKVEGELEPLLPINPQAVTQKSPSKNSVTVNNVTHGELTQKQQTPSKPSQQSKDDVVSKEEKGQKDQNTISMKHKSKKILKDSASIQEKCDTVKKSSKDQQESKSFPQFESYIVEEEEGSGGYGTVYRARRKNDGIKFAVKCPHENAHKHHVKNELKMLERFGGRNYVIKYEGSFKHGDSDCFVLEHVEHDRPEVLKRDINIPELQRYGYCMFRALTSLHKQGVLHRDVKPGNFLFSRQTSKGYLIDFNLAKDLHQKHENVALQSKCVSPSKRRKILGGTSSGKFKTGASTGSNLESKKLKKTLDNLKAYDDLGRRSSINSHGGDASGLTSAKDITHSTERLREPLPFLGRKELINLAQKAMQSPNLGAAGAPTSKRKRVAASPGTTDRKPMYVTPMPLQSSGVAIPGAGSLKNKGEKPKDGPCVGTKGFRAPEVLLRSLHQSPKMDVWSAGVTLLYLITGKLPFTGEPDQNMKDIAKMRGNEELWEVAKLHNRESSFPKDLLDIRFFSSMKIKEWCVANTRRPEFLEVIPQSLFDLLEKCLTVNPRLRITAEDALMHEFFAPCHKAYQKQKLLGRGPNQDFRSKPSSLAHELSTVKPRRPPHEQISTPVKL